jgi:hypothetical protein
MNDIVVKMIYDFSSILFKYFIENFDFVLNRNQISFLRGFPIDRLYEIPNGIQNCHFG